MLPSPFQFAVTLLCLSTIVACAPRQQNSMAPNATSSIANTQGINGKPLYQNSLLPDETNTTSTGIVTSTLSNYDNIKTGSIQPGSSSATYSNPMGTGSNISQNYKNVYQPQQSVASPNQSVFNPSVPVASGSSYQVMAGDTIYSIGRKFNTPPSTIMSINNMNSLTTLSVGQKIMLPNNTTTNQYTQPTQATSSYSTDISSSASYSSPTQYNVQSGDTIYAIGRKFNMRPSEIIQKNPHINPNQLSVGQTITISQNNKTTNNTTTSSASGDNLEKIKEKLQSSMAQSQTISSSQPNSKPQQTAFNNPTIKPLGQTNPSSYSPSSQNNKEQASLGKILEMPVQGAIKEEKNLRGILISAKDGDRVKASADGEVIYVGNLSNYGNMILVRHSNGLVTNYARLKKTFVRKGQRVNQGDLIAAAGATQGFNSSDVLFEVRKGTKAVNPLDYTS